MHSMLKKQIKNFKRVTNFFNDFVIASIATFIDKSEIFKTYEKKWEIKQKVVIFDANDNKSVKNFSKSFITGLQLFERWEFDFLDPLISSVFSHNYEVIAVICDVLIPPTETLVFIPAYRPTHILHIAP